MNCPFCKEDNNRVIDIRKRKTHDYQRRVRLCMSCGKVFTTIEEYVPSKEWQTKKEFGKPLYLQGK